MAASEEIGVDPYRLMTDQAKTFEFFDHTADIGIRAEGRTLEELFARMAQGLMALLVEDSAVIPAQRRPIRLSAPDVEMLLLAWLQELLFWFSADGFVSGAYVLGDVRPTQLEGEVRGEPFDMQRHAQGREVKAITRHGLAVRQTPNGWQAEVIVDI